MKVFRLPTVRSSCALTPKSTGRTEGEAVMEHHARSLVCAGVRESYLATPGHLFTPSTSQRP